jgi:hypothetical protein
VDKPLLSWAASAATHGHLVGRAATRHGGLTALLAAKVALPDALDQEYKTLSAHGSASHAIVLDDEDDDEEAHEEEEDQPAAAAAATPAGGAVEQKPALKFCIVNGPACPKMLKCARFCPECGQAQE